MSRPKPPGTQLHRPRRDPRSRSKRRYDELQRHEARVVPPVQRLLQTLEAVTARELARIAQRQENNEPVSSRDLDSLASAIRKTHQTQREVLADYEDEMRALDDEREIERIAEGEDDES